MTAAEDEKLEAAILHLVLSSPGASRTMPELSRRLNASRDDVNRSLCSLADYGLLEFKGGRTESLWPTLAARSCGRLLRVVR
jgi:DNA-binding GntR family transcriptional regulator